MSTTAGNNTLDRIQKEIKDSLQREDELRNKYEKLQNNNDEITNDNRTVEQQPVKPSSSTVFFNAATVLMNGNGSKSSSNSNPKLNGWRRFTPNTTTRGVMQKFLKMRGKLTQPAVQSSNKAQNNWNYDDTFEPAKVTVERGKPARNGFISAEEKMKRELDEFQMREAELRKERRKSQPDIMASLEQELQIDSDFAASENNNFLSPAKSMANIYSASEDDLEFRNNNHSSAPCSLKPARSLALLCDVSDEELDTPGTYSLIMQFEKLKSQQVRS